MFATSVHWDKYQVHQHFGSFRNTDFPKLSPKHLTSSRPSLRLAHSQTVGKSDSGRLALFLQREALEEAKIAPGRQHAFAVVHSPSSAVPRPASGAKRILERLPKSRGLLLQSPMISEDQGLLNLRKVNFFGMRSLSSSTSVIAFS